MSATARLPDVPVDLLPASRPLAEESLEIQRLVFRLLATIAQLEAEVEQLRALVQAYKLADARAEGSA